MPRAARLDFPGAMHHVIARGIERRSILRDDQDRLGFLNRIAEVINQTRLELLAWCMMTNHCHFLVRTGPTPLSSCMHRLLGGHAGAFNRRHRRVGHLFQGRFFSTLVDADEYFLELIRYIHLNPVIAGIVSIDDLDQYPWTGHSALLGNQPFSAQNTDDVLRQFGTRVGAARTAYRQFVRDGWLRKTYRRFDGGGLRRSARGWEAVENLARGRESWTFDERILGSSEFVCQVLAREGSAPTRPCEDAEVVASRLTEAVAGKLGVPSQTVASRSKRPVLVEARAIISYVAATKFEMTRVSLARALGVSVPSVLRGIESGARRLSDRGWTVDQVLLWANLAQPSGDRLR